MIKTSRTKLISRGGGRRDARLIVIAPEGSETEKQYFEGLQQRGVIDRRRVIVEVLASAEDTHSAPKHLLQRLQEFEQRHDIVKGLDQLWLVLDLDHWSAPSHIHNLTAVIQRARQRGYFVAVSNPCFELWLLLHFTADIDEVRAAASLARACDACEAQLRVHAGSYNKANIQREWYTAERVHDAMGRAKALDSSPDDRWPQSTGTHVYRLAEVLLEQHRRNASLPREGA